MFQAGDIDNILVWILQRYRDDWRLDILWLAGPHKWIFLKHNNLLKKHCYSTIFRSLYSQCHAKRDLRTYAKSVDPDQPPCLRRRVWSGSAFFDNHNINSTYFSCYVSNFIMYMCFQHRIGADLGLHYVKCPKVPFLFFNIKMINLITMKSSF